MAYLINLAEQFPRLRPEHESMILFDKDKRLLEIVYGMPREFLETLNRTYAPSDLRAYNTLERKWFETEKWLLGTHPETNGQVSEEALMDDMEREDLHLRFKAFYILSNPDMVKRLEEI